MLVALRDDVKKKSEAVGRSGMFLAVLSQDEVNSGLTQPISCEGDFFTGLHFDSICFGPHFHHPLTVATTPSQHLRLEAISKLNST